MSAKKARNTEVAYAHAWKVFCQWCVAAGRPSLPASSETVSLYVASLLEGGLHVRTVRVKLAGIADRHAAALHPNPVTPEVRALVVNASRLLRQVSRPKRAVTIELVARVAALDLTSCVRDERDRAMFLFLFALGWRRGELASLNLGDVDFVGRRGVIVRLGASKTDQAGKGRVVSVPYGSLPQVCPVLALRRWLDLRGSWRGPLFCSVNAVGTALVRCRVSGQVVCEAVQRLLARVGEDPAAYGAHSLRSGMITAAAEAGAGEIQIMQRTGQRSIGTVLAYVRPAQAFRSDPLAGVLWPGAAAAI